MRARLLLVLMLPMLAAGCAEDADGDQAPAVRGFAASYDLHIEAEAPDGSIYEWSGILELHLSGPTDIADRDLVLRPAYQLRAVTRLTDRDGGEHLDTRVHHLDGAMLVVRTDVDCIAYCLSASMRSWESQGAPAPFALGWGTALRYQVDGAWTQTPLVDTTDGRGLPEGTILPFAADQVAGLRFVPGEHGVAASISAVWPEDPNSPYDGELRSQAVLRSVQREEVLPSIAAWPLREWGAAAARAPTYVAGEDDEAFGMGVTYRTMYDELLNRSETARETRTKACSQSGFLYYGGGWRIDPLEPIDGGGDSLAAVLRLATPTLQRSWEIRYSAERNPVIALTRTDDPYSSVEEYGRAGRTTECLARTAAPATPLNDVLRASWGLDLRTGDPCGIQFGPATYGRAGLPGVALGGQQASTWLSPPSDEKGWGWDLTGQVTYNVEDGQLVALYVNAEDAARLDRAGLGGRPLPTEERDLLGGGGFRCVPPDYTEFGIPPRFTWQPGSPWPA